jgi:hypothetical protein
MDIVTELLGDCHIFEVESFNEFQQRYDGFGKELYSIIQQKLPDLFKHLNFYKIISITGKCAGSYVQQDSFAIYQKNDKAIGIQLNYYDVICIWSFDGLSFETGGWSDTPYEDAIGFIEKIFINMVYKVLIVDDKGAVNFSNDYYDLPFKKNDYKDYLEKNKRFHETAPPIILEMYDDPNFNSVTDFLHSLEDYMINDKVKSVLRNFNIPPHKFITADVFRKERKFLFKKNVKYSYNWFYFDCEYIENFLEHVDFEASTITLTKNSEVIAEEISSLEHLNKIRADNKKNSNAVNALYKTLPENEAKAAVKNGSLYGTSWRAEKIVFKKTFPSSIDIFNIPLLSPHTYVSESLRKALVNEKITGIEFIDAKGNNPDPKYTINPLIEFL